MNANHFLIAGPDLTSWFSSFDSHQRLVLVTIGVVFITALVLILAGILAGTWKAIKEKQIEADLKRDMLDRGMTAEEIEKVIEATPHTALDRWMGSWCKKR
jgi:hypothetical protein